MTKAMGTFSVICLVSLPKNGHFAGRFSAEDTRAASAGLFHGDAAQRGLGGFFNLLFALCIAAPTRFCKSLLHRHAEFLQILWLLCVLVAEGQRAVEERFLNRLKQLRDGFGDAFLRDEALAFLAGLVAPRQHNTAIGH